MKNWKKICTLSLVHFMAFPEMQTGEGEFVQSIQRLGKLNFFDALEMGSINGPRTRVDVVRAAHDYGFRLGFGAQPLILSQGINLNSLDAAVHNAGIDKLKAALDQAAELHAGSFVVLSGKDPGPDERAQAYEVLSDALQVLGNYAKLLGIRLVLEIFDRSVDKCSLVGPAPEARSLAEKVRRGYSEFGLLYDMGHMPLLDETPEFALPLIKDYLAEVHLGNCVKLPGASAYGDKHPRFDYPGGVNGTAELVHFLRSLFDVGYLNEDANPEELPWVGFEVRPQAGETVKLILENIRKTWENAWQQLD
ncbi:MAG TPA: TIM barrel protein [Longilinea sp.]|nr:TIM barrel protein [Longilinea sp.]